MQALLAEARTMGCSEAWLGTEHDNVAALATYRKLMKAGDEEAPMSVFTFALT